MRVREMMTRNVGSCRPETNLQNIAKMMLDCDCGAIPVVDDASRPVGILTDRDIVTRVLAAGQNPLQKTASEVMTHGVTTIDPEADVRDCERLMEAKQIRRIVVVDEQGVCCGIVSQADIALCTPDDEAAEVLRDISQPGYSTGTAAYPA